MYNVAFQIITQLCIFLFFYVIYTILSLSYTISPIRYCNNSKNYDTLTSIMFFLLLLMSVIYNNNGDYYTYRNWFLYGYGETAKTDEWIEPIYYWIKFVIPPVFILFRFVIWGTGIFIYKKLCEKLGINILLAYVLFGVFYIFAYSYARVSLGIMITSYAFVLLIKRESNSFFHYIKIILLFLLASLLHKSCLSLVFILLLSLLLKFNGTTLILLAILFIPISSLLNSNLVTIFEYIGLSDIQSERYLKTNDDFIDKTSEIIFYVPILILLIVSIVKLYKNRKVIPIHIQRVVMGTITILYVASILTTLSLTATQIFFIRFSLMAFVLALICCIYAIQNLKISKVLLVILIFWCSLYYCYSILVMVKYGAPQLLERFYL